MTRKWYMTTAVEQGIREHSTPAPENAHTRLASVEVGDHLDDRHRFALATSARYPNLFRERSPHNAGRRLSVTHFSIDQHGTTTQTTPNRQIFLRNTDPVESHATAAYYSCY